MNAPGITLFGIFIAGVKSCYSSVWVQETNKTPPRYPPNDLMNISEVGCALMQAWMLNLLCSSVCINVMINLQTVCQLPVNEHKHAFTPKHVITSLDTSGKTKRRSVFGIGVDTMTLLVLWVCALLKSWSTDFLYSFFPSAWPLSLWRLMSSILWHEPRSKIGFYFWCDCYSQ